MEYFVSIQALGHFPKIQLDKQEFQNIKEARTALSHGLSIEEKYEIIISNYLEFEKEILEQSILFMAQNRFQYSDQFQKKLNFNIKLVNLLTSTRLYIDQLYQHIEYANPELSNGKDSIKNILANEYDKKFEYRFMEALRNYVQHRGLPIHLLKSHSERNSNGQMSFAIELYSQKERLEEDKKFKRKVLEEMPEKINLKEVVRGYIESISAIHIKVRKMLSSFLERSRYIIEKVQSDYRELYPRKIVGLYALCVEDNVVLDKIPLLLEWDDIRLKLTKQNSQLTNLRHSFVTGKILDS